jgi:membrane glycosyltransferase
LWLLLLIVGLIQSFRAGAPIVDLGTPVWLIAATLMLLFGSKLMALIWAAFDRKLVQRLGGWRAIALGFIVDVPLSILSAPIIMASQCYALIDILSGRPSGWHAQSRESKGVPLMASFEHYRWHVLLGLPFWLTAMADLGTGVWQLPVAIGLLGAPLFATWTSRSDWGARAARYGLFAADPGAAVTSVPLPDREQAATLAAV